MSSIKCWICYWELLRGIEPRKLTSSLYDSLSMKMDLVAMSSSFCDLYICYIVLLLYLGKYRLKKQVLTHIENKTEALMQEQKRFES